MRSVGIILLAAGGSVRMGRPKQLLPFGETTLLRHATRTALATGFSPVVVVLGAEMAACATEIEDLPVLLAHNPHWAQGMGTSLRVGMETLEEKAPATEAVMILLHDQPRIAAAMLQELAALWKPPQFPISAAFYGETLGVPAVFDRSFFPELKNLEASQGAKKIFLRHASAVARLDVPAAADDIDSPEDYRHISPGVV